MTRGRYLKRALDLADEIAKKRGQVQQYRPGPGMICHLSIFIPSCLAQVRIKRVRHLRCSLVWLEREAEADLAGLRLMPLCPGISRELWICSPTGIFRFFRVGDSSLAELDRDGRLLTVRPAVPSLSPPAPASQPPSAGTTSPSVTTTPENPDGE